MERMGSVDTEIEALRKMTEEEREEYLAPWRPYAPEDLQKMILSSFAEMTEELADTKSYPLEAGPEIEKKGNETLVGKGRIFGGPFSEENLSKFVLRKKGYIIKDKQVTPPNPLPETFAFSEETMSRIELRRLGYTFSDEIVPEEDEKNKKSYIER